MRTARTEQERDAEARRVAALPYSERLASLTERQRAIYGFIRERVIGGLPPTVRDICRGFDITPNGGTCHLTALERKGLIRRDKLTARGITLVDPPACPHCGKRSADPVETSDA
jgi:SOS-response transcriptional repressor LexA